jgi:hypothetical protein
MKANGQKERKAAADSRDAGPEAVPRGREARKL